MLHNLGYAVASTSVSRHDDVGNGAMGGAGMATRRVVIWVSLSVLRDATGHPHPRFLCTSCWLLAQNGNQLQCFGPTLPLRTTEPNMLAPLSFILLLLPPLLPLVQLLTLLLHKAPAATVLVIVDDPYASREKENHKVQSTNAT